MTGGLEAFTVLALMIFAMGAGAALMFLFVTGKAIRSAAERELVRRGQAAEQALIETVGPRGAEKMIEERTDRDG